MVTQDERLHASRKIARLLRAEIKEAKYPPGARLPSIQQLMAKHGVAKNTAQKALQLLQAEGLVEIRAQSGAYALAPTVEPLADASARAELAELTAKLQRAAEELTGAQQVVAALLGRLPDEDLAR